MVSFNRRHEHADGLDDNHRALLWHLIIDHDMQDQPGALRRAPLSELANLHRGDHGEVPGQIARGLFQPIESSWASWAEHAPIRKADK